MRKDRELVLAGSYLQLRQYILDNDKLDTEDRFYLKQPTVEYFDHDSIAIDAFNAKDCLPFQGQYIGNEESYVPQGEYENPGWAWFRVATYIASAELDDGFSEEEAAEVAIKWYRMMYRREMVPGGQVIRGSANTNKVSLINCTTVKLADDSIEGIYEADFSIAKVESRGEGVGVDVSMLRPKGTKVHNAALTTSGAVSWMQRFDNTTATIAQNGRRGALLISIDIRHPEVLDFIRVKSDLRLINNANISVRISDEFMNAYLEDQDWQFYWVNPVDGEVVYGETMKARAVMRELVEYSAKYAEPGILFWDTAKRYSNSDALGFPIVGVNACSEQCLCHLDSCVLAHQNFATLPTDQDAAVNECRRRGYMVSWFCDNVVTKQIVDNRSPLPQSREISFALRRIGAGPTGFADYFAKLGLKYGSTDSKMLADLLMRAHTDGAYQRSKDAAELKGPFPGYDPDLDNSEFMENHPELKGPRRNVCCTTCAPVGTGMILLGGDGNGVEPWLYFYAWRRTRVAGEYRWYFVVNKQVLKLLTDSEAKWVKSHIKKLNGIEPVNEDRIQLEDGVIALLNEKFPNGVETCHSINELDKSDMMGLIQESIDSSISVTYNLSQATTLEQIEELYVRCWQNGLKGVAIYREDPENRPPIFQYDRPTTFNYGTQVKSEGAVPKRPAVLAGATAKVVADGYKFYFTFNCDDDNRLCEVFVSTNEQEPKVNTEAAQAAVVQTLINNGVPKDVLDSQIKQAVRQAGYVKIARLISIGLRCGVSVFEIVEALSTLEVPVSSYIYQLRRGLSNYMEAYTTQCPDCGEDMVVSAGCKSCAACGYSKC